MRKNIRFISLLLALLMLLPSCSGDGDTAADTANAETQPETPAETEADPNLRANHFDALPDTLDFGGATLEALCSEAHRTYMDAFLETAMKTKYSRDELSGQCIDLIMDGLTKNTLDEYNSSFGGIMTSCIYNPMKNNPGSFASTFQSAITAAETAWAKALAAMQE